MPRRIDAVGKADGLEQNINKVAMETHHRAHFPFNDSHTDERNNLPNFSKYILSLLRNEINMNMCE